MCKYIDYEEQKRLSRLKNIRGSINNQHNSWQANQLEKRRKEQMRQRKRDEEAKKRRRRAAEKTKNKGAFLVDTTATGTAPYEFTKCGLKLRLEKSYSSTTTTSSALGSEKRRMDVKRDDANTDTKSESKQQLPLVSKYAIDSIELNRRKPPHVRKKNVVKRKEQSCGGPDPDAGGRGMNAKKKEDANSIKPPGAAQKRKQQQDSIQTANSGSSSSSSTISKGKENGDNPNRSSNQSASENTTQACKQTSLTKGKQLLQKKKPINKKSSESYFMDFESLKREHADAIEMLKQLDEENKRLFVRKDGDGLDVDTKWIDREEEEEREDINDDVVEESSAVITLPEGMLCATHLSISLHDSIGDDCLQEQDDQEVGSKSEAELSVKSDDESEAGQLSSICSRSSHGKDSEDEEDLVDWECGADTDVVEVH